MQSPTPVTLTADPDTAQDPDTVYETASPDDDRAVSENDEANTGPDGNPGNEITCEGSDGDAVTQVRVGAAL